MSNSTRKNNKKRNSNTKLIANYNEYVEELGKMIIQETRLKNVEILLSIQTVKNTIPIFKNKYIENIVEKNPSVTPEIISKTICFAALIYKNDAIFKLIKTHFIPNLDIHKHNDYLLTMIGPFFPEAEIVGGVDNELVIPTVNNTTRSEKKKIQMFIPWFFVISLLSFLWVSFISYNQLLFIQTELETNTAFALVKDITSAAFTCNFNNIHLSKEEESIFKVIRYSKTMDKRLVDAIENTLKLRKCALDPNNILKTEVFNQNIRTGQKTTSYQKQILNINTNIVPNEFENKEVISNSLALVPTSSAVAMLVPTETMTKYIANYNSKIYGNVEKKIRMDMESLRKNGNVDPTALIQYFEKMQKMNLKDFQEFFDEIPIQPGAAADYNIPNLTDLKNILGIFGSNQNSLFEIFIKGFSGMNIIEVTYADYKKRMLSIHTELTIKSAQLNEYIENLIIDSSSLLSLLISFKTILCWFVTVSLIFGGSSYKMAQYIREQMRKKPQTRNLLETKNTKEKETKENKKKTTRQKVIKET